MKLEILLRQQNESKKGAYEKDFISHLIQMLTLNKMLKLHMLIVIVRSAFEEDGNIIHKFFSMFI